MLVRRLPGRAACAAAVLLLALLAAGCLRLPQETGTTGNKQGNGDSQAPPAPGGSATPSVSWSARQDDELPADVRRWLEEHQARVGIFRRTFGDTTYILVSWGERRGGGYSVQVGDVRPVGDDTLVLTADLADPRPGQATSQAITYPHAVVSVTPAADYELLPVFRGTHFLQNSAFEVMEPQPFTRVKDRVRIRGRARVFEANFQVRVEDDQGELAQQVVQASEGAPGWGEFDVELVLKERPRSREGRLVLFEPSAEDGTPIHVLTVPLRFETGDT
ncbi:MAG: hypothetical protein DIU69_02630 [Bacillota bacterium]|nr:MAG: hypothetical protein DIU69_02630 [Bacillota bacterium]